MSQAIIAKYTARAFDRLGIQPGQWNPSLGFRANLPILERLYPYYQELYFERPDQFLWAGLARLTGGQVLYGMQHLVKIARDPCLLTTEIMAVAKDIFENLAWQHEFFLDDPDELIAVCRQTDPERSHRHPYALGWEAVASGQPGQIDTGNRMLLENEQYSTIQVHYDRIKTDAYSRRFFFLTRFTMRNIHPHHRRFIVEFPLGDVTVFADRWKWITHERGMWPRWAGMRREERDRLVGLSNTAVMRHEW